MNLNTISKTFIVAFAMAAMPVAAAALQDNYPQRPIRLICAFAAGGGNDIIARRLAQKLTESLGQSVVVENRPGASGVIGSDLVAKAQPDGYMILIASPTLTVNPSLMKKMPFDATRDLAAVSLIGRSPHLLAVHPSVPAQSVKALVDFAKARKGELAFSSGSTGGSSHLSAELFNSIAGIRMIHVPYRGTGQAVLAMVSGEVSLGFNDVATTLPHVKTGRLRGIAVTSLKRSSAVPSLPTIAESGYPGFESGVWYGVVAPARTPPEIIALLNSEMVKIVASPDFVQGLAAEGAEPASSTPEYLDDFIKKETARWAKIIAEAKITAE